MDNEYGDAQEVEEAPAPAQSVPEATPKIRKQLPQRNVDAFWDKVCTLSSLANASSSCVSVYYKISRKSTLRPASRRLRQNQSLQSQEGGRERSGRGEIL